MKSVIRVFLALSLVANWADFASAQALPFTKKVLSQEAYASAIEKNDRKLLNAPCMKYVQAANESFDHLELKSCQDLADYIRTLEEKVCPNVQTTIARVLKNGEIDLRGRKRMLKVGERCLYDNNEASWFTSLSCGNFITQDLPIFTAHVEEKVPAVDEDIEGEDEVDFDAAVKEAVDKALKESKRHKRPDTDNGGESWLERNWWIPTLIAVGIGAGCAIGGCLSQEINIVR